MEWLITSKPLAIVMLVPIIVSIHVTSITYVKVVSISSIMLFLLGNVLSNRIYIDLWIISIYFLFYSLVKAKNLFLKSEEKEEDDYRAFNGETHIYERDFKHDFTYEEFKQNLMKNCTLRRNKNKKKLFCSQGAPFDKIYYFVTIPKNCLMTLKHQKTTISYLKDGVWIGVVEFISQLFDDSQRKWMIGLEAENTTEDEVIWFEWSKDHFHKLFKNYKSTLFLKKLLTNWVKYLSVSTYKMDDHVATALGVISNKRLDKVPDALPLFRHISAIHPQETEEFEPQEKNPLLINEI